MRSEHGCTFVFTCLTDLHPIAGREVKESRQTDLQGEFRSEVSYYFWGFLCRLPTHVFFCVCVCLIQHQKHRHPKIVGHDFEMMMNFTGEDMDVFAKFETQRL